MTKNRGERDTYLFRHGKALEEGETVGSPTVAIYFNGEDVTDKFKKEGDTILATEDGKDVQLFLSADPEQSLGEHLVIQTVTTSNGRILMAVDENLAPPKLVVYGL